MASILSLLMTTFGAWLLYSLFAHGVARWLGGRARFGQILGAIGLAYAPLLLYALEVIPGFVVPAVVVTLLLLATKYLAIRQTYGLDIGYSIVVVLAPYAIGALLLLALVLFGGAIGLSRVPGLDNVFRLLPFLPR
jgi:hypothetical protein